MIKQLQPPLPLMTPKGESFAYFIIDYGLDYNLMWVCFDNKDGECWIWDNSQIRAVKNITIGRELKKNNLNYK